MRKTVTLEQIITFLLETPLFEGLLVGELSQIVKIIQMKTLGDGQVLCREGKVGDAWYVVFQGEVEVTKSQGQGKPDRVVATLGPRSCIGEMAVLDGQPRSASVKAKGDAVILGFPRASFNGLLLDGELAAYKLVLEMAKVLSARQRSLTAQLSSMINTEQIAAGEASAIEPILDDHAVSE